MTLKKFIKKHMVKQDVDELFLESFWRVILEEELLCLEQLKSKSLFIYFK